MKKLKCGNSSSEPDGPPVPPPTTAAPACPAVPALAPAGALDPPPLAAAGEPPMPPLAAPTAELPARDAAAAAPTMPLTASLPERPPVGPAAARPATAPPPDAAGPAFVPPTAAGGVLPVAGSFDPAQVAEADATKTDTIPNSPRRPIFTFLPRRLRSIVTKLTFGHIPHSRAKCCDEPTIHSRATGRPRLEDPQASALSCSHKRRTKHRGVATACSSPE
jgi:hypothetical protein